MPKLPTNAPGDHPRADGTAPVPPPAESAVRHGVMAGLGRPPDLYRVAVVPLWGAYYRVNVLTGSDPTAVRVAHSYFVEVGAGGAILASVPRITRLYE